MLLLPDKNPPFDPDTILFLEKEIAALEAELIALETEINIFQARIRSALSPQIQRILELTILYKNQKSAKKLKRLEQKMRGKNYKEPLGLKMNDASFTVPNFVSADDQQELKRLYKEAIVQIHPDKFADANEELNERATAVTSQLIEVYKSGDLEELNRLHEHIISGNALTYIPDQPETVNDPQAMMLFLQDKKRKLQKLLPEIQTSAIYGLWLNRKDIPALIAELKTGFAERILILEKRTQ